MMIRSMGYDDTEYWRCCGAYLPMIADLEISRSLTSKFWSTMNENKLSGSCMEAAITEADGSDDESELKTRNQG